MTRKLVVVGRFTGALANWARSERLQSSHWANCQHRSGLGEAFQDDVCGGGHNASQGVRLGAGSHAAAHRQNMRFANRRAQALH